MPVSKLRYNNGKIITTRIDRCLHMCVYYLYPHDWSWIEWNLCVYNLQKCLYSRFKNTFMQCVILWNFMVSLWHHEALYWRIKGVFYSSPHVLLHDTYMVSCKAFLRLTLTMGANNKGQGQMLSQPRYSCHSRPTILLWNWRGSTKNCGWYKGCTDFPICCEFDPIVIKMSRNLSPLLNIFWH